MNFLQRCKYYGFNGESHLVTTSDDYILQVFRVNDSKPGLKPAIYMHHGSQCCGYGFLCNQDQSPAFLLAK